MRNLTLALCLILLSLGCKKKNNEQDLGWKCVYGIKKTTGQREFIYCTIQEIINCGTNQAAADIVAEKYGVPKVSVGFSGNYTDKEYIPSSRACNCQ